MKTDPPATEAVNKLKNDMVHNTLNGSWGIFQSSLLLRSLRRADWSKDYKQSWAAPQASRESSFPYVLGESVNDLIISRYFKE